MVEKKTGELSPEKKRAMLEPEDGTLSLRRQCELLDFNRSSYYYQPAQESEWNLLLMRLLDEQYLKTPFYGSRRMTQWLKEQGHEVNRKRVQSLMEKMRLHTLYPKKRQKRGEESKIYPYLLKDVEICRPNQAWCSDITYIPMRRGFVYLVAVMDWYSRFVLSWVLSNTLDLLFCLEALEKALARGKPTIFHSDQGSQYTSKAFTARLLEAEIEISMDGKGRCFDNIFMERLWRTLKYENVYLRDYADVPSLQQGLTAYFQFYNHERFHQSLNYRVPAEVHFGA